MNIISAWESVINGFDFTALNDILIKLIPAVICITFHECCHGICAYLLGDDTAKRAGRLTLNPVRHIDVFGLVLLAAFHVGWAKPVPVNMNNFRSPKKGMALTALAGPAGNFLLACVFLALYGLLFNSLQAEGFRHTLLNMIFYTAYLNIGLGVFNLIPISPLDGSKVLFSILSDKQYSFLMKYEKYGMLLLVVLVVSGLLSTPLNNCIDFVFEKMFSISYWTYNLTV